jgi:LacI family repressor for deo operon, udp, cdd, tsx, nupC, and nupG
LATIYEVARKAGVSTATVSRVMSGPTTLVSAATRQRVLRAVEQLGYVPNAAAKNLRTLRTRTLIVTVPDITNPFFALILQGIEEAAHREGYAVLLGDTQHDPERENHYARMVRRREADGLIFLGHRLPPEAASLVAAAAPKCAPVVNGCEFSPQLGVPSVHIDNAKAAAEAMAHLYSIGHRRIGIVSGSLASPLSRDRLRGATTAARAAGHHDKLVTVHGDFSIGSGVAGAERLLQAKTPPTAIFCFNDEMAMGALEAARHRGLRVPEQLSVMGFDDIRFARHANPPLTTVAQPTREIGEGCVRLLLEILRGEAMTPVSVTLPHELMLRASTGPVRESRKPGSRRRQASA